MTLHGVSAERTPAKRPPEPATMPQGSLLAERGTWTELRARAVLGDGDAGRLAELLTRQGRGKEAERLRRFGLAPDGSTASG